ncbi:MAG: metal-dependent hydrolase [Candidatus Acidiferrum sp.]
MDLVTHGLASLAIVRGLFPRAGKAATASAVVVGVAADVDWLSNYLSPSVFLNWHGTYFHSILAAILYSILPVIFFAVLGSIWGGIIVPIGHLKEDEAASDDPKVWRPFVLRSSATYGLAAPFSCALLHIAMDACQSDGVMLFWPFSSRRIAADWLPGIDPWILTILIGAIAIPELLRLVGSEIGAKSKKPRGQTGALIGLALILVYVGARATLHSNATSLLSSRAYHGETARRAWAYPETLSLLTWRGVVETESALDEIDVNVAAASDFDPDYSLRIFKPEPSPALQAARNTNVAKRFLATAQIPKASVEKTETGYVVVLRDLRYEASGQTKHEVAAYIELDRNSQVTSQEFVWARDSRN